MGHIFLIASSIWADISSNSIAVKMVSPHQEPNKFKPGFIRESKNFVHNYFWLDLMKYAL